VDQFFDRLGDFLKSAVGGSGADYDSGFKKTGDADLDAAYAELNDFLNNDMTDSERRERDEARRADAAKERPKNGSGAYRAQAKPSASPYPAGLDADFALFNLKPGVKMPELKTRYKKLLMENHPDRYAGNSDHMARATEYCVKLNSAYQRIETWFETGRYQGA
jgi:DnaJ-domain-containing protein 1